MKHPDNMIFELDYDWYEYLSTEFEDELRAAGFELKYRITRGKNKKAELCIFCDERSLAFDADVSWDTFLLADKGFAESFPLFFMLVSSNPTYYKAQVRRTGHRSLSLECEIAEYDISSDYHEDDLIHAGYFKGSTVGEVVSQIGVELVKACDYIEDVAKSMAKDFKKRIDDEYNYQYDHLYQEYVQKYDEWLEEERKNALRT